MQDRLKGTGRKVIHALIHYRDLCDVYYLKSSWLTNATAAGLLAQHAAWEELAARKIDLDRAIRMLPLRQRRVIVRRFIKQETLEEIAKALKIEESTAWYEINRAIKEIARILGENW